MVDKGDKDWLKAQLDGLGARVDDVGVRIDALGETVEESAIENRKALVSALAGILVEQRGAIAEDIGAAVGRAVAKPLAELGVRLDVIGRNTGEHWRGHQERLDKMEAELTAIKARLGMNGGSDAPPPKKT